MTKFKTKHKAFAFLGAAFVLLAALIFTGCKQTGSSGGGMPSTPADVGSFEDTGDGFIKINPPANGIAGVEPAYTLPGTNDSYKGVFRAGRKVKLSLTSSAKRK